MDVTPWEFALLALASYRLWQLAANDDIADRPREWLIARMPSWFEEQVECPWCAGFWISGAVLATFCAVNGWVGFFWFGATWLALSCTVGIMGHYLTR